MCKAYKTFGRGTRHVEGIRDMWKGYETCGRSMRHVEGV